MPRFFRSMRSDSDGFPELPKNGPVTSAQLGVRPAEVTLGPAGVVVAGGMSVAPNWRDLDHSRIPKRLRGLVPGAEGSEGPSSLRCFRFGDGPFADGPINARLRLALDSSTHATVTAGATMSLEELRVAVAATRPGWSVDET